jgi:hypothetical protein
VITARATVLDLRDGFVALDGRSVVPMAVQHEHDTLSALTVSHAFLPMPLVIDCSPIRQGDKESLFA